MLCPELRDRDIPHRTTIHKRVMEVLDEYLVELTSQLKVSFTSHASFDIADSLFRKLLARFL
jgi:hypothetical protein